VGFSLGLALEASTALAYTFDQGSDLGALATGDSAPVGFTYTVGDTLLDGTLPSLHTVAKGDSFADTYSFTLANAQKVSVNLTSFEVLTFWTIGDFGGTVGSGSGENFVVELAAGSWSLVVGGNIDGTAGSQYGGAVTVGAVPLPADDWLFGSAIMGLTLVARRRNQRSGALTA